VFLFCFGWGVWKKRKSTTLPGKVAFASSDSALNRFEEEKGATDQRDRALQKRASFLGHWGGMLRSIIQMMSQAQEVKGKDQNSAL